MRTYLLIMLGSGLGGAARFWCTGAVIRSSGAAFPFGTVVVNVIGCALIGFVAGWTGSEGKPVLPLAVRQFVMPGFCGGFTTFSAFSLETLVLARDGAWGRAAANVFLSLALCLAAVWLGHLAARKTF